jgi:hypothetical protein
MSSSAMPSGSPGADGDAGRSGLLHDFDHPEAPKPLLLPPGQVRRWSRRWAISSTVCASACRTSRRRRSGAPHKKLSSELEARNKQILSDLENTARTHGFGVRTVQGAVQTFPILHGKPLSAEQFDVLDENTKRALQTAADRLTREVEKAAAWSGPRVLASRLSSTAPSPAPRPR